MRGLLRLAPPSGPQRYDFAASLLRGMGSEQHAEPDLEGEALARRFDMVWDLVKGMRADAEAAAAAGLSHGSKYDPVWRLLEEARLDLVRRCCLLLCLPRLLAAGGPLLLSCGCWARCRRRPRGRFLSGSHCGV